MQTPDYLNIILNILKSEMDMQSTDAFGDRFIYEFNQNFELPNTAGLKIQVGFSYSKPMATNRTIEYITNDDLSITPIEKHKINAMAVFQVDLMSRDSTATNELSNVTMALNSIFSKQQQEKYGFRIMPISETIFNASEIQGGSTENRYTITFNTFVWYYKEKEITTNVEYYYDTFNAQVSQEEPFNQFDLDEIK